MRQGAAFLTFIAKAVTCFWAILLLAVTAALQAKLNDRLGTDIVNNSNLAGGNAILAACVFTIVYFVAQLIVQWKRPESIVLATFIDVAVLGFLTVLVLGGVAAESTESGYFNACQADRFFRDGCDFGGLGKAVLGLGWLFWFMVLGLFVWELVYTFMRFGHAWSTWKTPFPVLLDRGAPVGTTRTDVESKSAIPMSTNASAPAQTTATIPHEA